MYSIERAGEELERMQRGECCRRGFEELRKVMGWLRLSPGVEMEEEPVRLSAPDFFQVLALRRTDYSMLGHSVHRRVCY